MTHSTKTTIADVLGEAATRMHPWRWIEGISGGETARQIRLAALSVTAWQGGNAPALAEGALAALRDQLGDDAGWLDSWSVVRAPEQVAASLRAAQAVDA